MSLKTVLYSEFYLLYIVFSIKVGNDIFIIRFIQELLYISSVKHFNKQLKRQIDNQEQFPSDDILYCFIVAQAATTLTKSLNRSSRLPLLKKTSTDFHQCWSLNLFTLFFVPNRLYAHDVKQESKDRYTDDQAPGTKQLFTDQQHDERIKDRQFRAAGHKLGIQDV